MLKRGIQRGNRKSSLVGYEEFLDSFENIDFDTFVDPFQEIKNEYNVIVQRRKPKCYSITYRNIPDILYIAFGEKDKCKGEATKYFRDNFHPLFTGRQWERCHIEARAIRQPALDKYSDDKKVPISALLSLGVSIPCCICKEGNFNMDDYRYGKCFVVEDEGDLNVFTKGYLLCPKCFHEHYNK